MKDTARDPSADFMEASDHADNVALNRNDAQIKTYKGEAGAIEPFSEDWPQFAKDAGATVRTKVIGPDGEPRYFYSKGIDVAAGPGPNRRLPLDVMDQPTFDAMTRDRALGFGLKYGAGASFTHLGRIGGAIGGS